MEKLKLTEDQKKALAEKYKGDFEKVMPRLLEAMMKQAATNPAALGGLDLKGMFK